MKFIVEGKTTAIETESAKTLKKEYGISHRLADDKKGVLQELKLSGALLLLDDIAKAKSDDKIHFGQSDNRSSARGYVTTSDSGWVGGSLKDLLNDMAGRKDISKLKETRNKIASGNFLSKLRMAVEDLIPRRKRSFSEHDGEWVMDRKWEPMPFMGTSRTNSSTHSLKVDVMFDANGSVSAESLSSYGAVIWSVVDILESSGVCCEVNYLMQSRGHSEGGHSLLTRMNVKRAGEYLAPNLLGGVFQTNFFRRAGFALIVAGADVVEQDASSGLGSAVYGEESIEFKPGHLFLQPALIQEKNMKDVIAQKLIECLSQAKGFAMATA